jgi:hypothetical protein
MGAGGRQTDRDRAARRRAFVPLGRRPPGRGAIFFLAYQTPQISREAKSAPKADKRLVIEPRGRARRRSASSPTTAPKRGPLLREGS